MEKLIRVGRLRGYIRDSPHSIEAAPIDERIAAHSKLLSEPRPTINYILGGPTNDQYQSNCQRKKLLLTATVRARVNTISASDNSKAIQPVDNPISFPPINPSRVITPHHDALVLTLCINHFDVHRVLVDPGCVIDLLHLPAFKQMQVPLDKISSVGKILFEFNRATTLTMGDINLPVKAGQVTQQVVFLVVEDLGPYNANLGRTWLHTIKAVPSTYHQTINYFTNAGQIDLQSNQLVARQCYQLSEQEREKGESSNNLATESESPK